MIKKWGIKLLLGLWFILAFPYLQMNFYQPYKAKPFEGNNFYNPYQNTFPLVPKIGNFHAHHHAWSGITNGKGSREELLNTYQKMGYDLLGISNYHKTDPFWQKEGMVPPVYEHGFGFSKNHQLVFGSDDICWTEFPFFQTLQAKQTVIAKALEKSPLVAIAHPSHRAAYNASDLIALRGYSLIEALHKNWPSMPLWDSVLSAGKPIFLLSNDDVHNPFEMDEIGRCFNLVYSPENHVDSVINALKFGRNIGVTMDYKPTDLIEDKAKRLKQLPIVEQFEVKNDTLFVALNKPAGEIRFIGQNGKIISQMQHYSAFYLPLDKVESYVRLELDFARHFSYYFNPIFRTNQKIDFDNQPEKRAIASWVFKIFTGLLLLLIAGYFIKN